MLEFRQFNNGAVPFTHSLTAPISLGQARGLLQIPRFLSPRKLRLIHSAAELEARGGRRFEAVLSGGASVMGDNRAILEYRRALRLRVAEYEREMLTGYRLAREVADCGLVQAGLRLETALAGLQSEIGLVRSHLLVLENIAEHPLKATD